MPYRYMQVNNSEIQSDEMGIILLNSMSEYKEKELQRIGHIHYQKTSDGPLSKILLHLKVPSQFLE